MAFAQDAQCVHPDLRIAAESNFDLLVASQRQVKRRELVGFQVIPVELVVEVHRRVVEASHERSRKLVAVVPEHRQEAVVCGLNRGVAFDIPRFLGDFANEPRVFNVKSCDPSPCPGHAIDKLLPLQVLGLDQQAEVIESIAFGDVALAFLPGKQRGRVLRCHAVGNRQNLIERHDLDRSVGILRGPFGIDSRPPVSGRLGRQHSQVLTHR